MHELPSAGIGHHDAMRKKIDAAVTKRNLSRAANNTKWDQHLNSM